MEITRSSNLHCYQQQKMYPTTYASASASASASARNHIATAEKSRVDFSKISNHEMKEWINSQIREEKISFDESFTFVAMTLNIPEYTGKKTSLDIEYQTVNLIDKAVAGLERAIQCNDKSTIKRLENAINIMKNQSTIQTCTGENSSFVSAHSPVLRQGIF